MAKRARPLSPHLQVYKPQLTSVMSIFHRITGMSLAGGTLLLTRWLDDGGTRRTRPGKLLLVWLLRGMADLNTHPAPPTSPIFLFDGGVAPEHFFEMVKSRTADS